MSVTKPTKYPQWASDGTTGQIVEPSTAKKALGWIIEKPPFQFFNWLFNLIYQWVEWFDQGYEGVVFVNYAATTTGTYTVPLGSTHLMVDTTGGAITLQLPDVTGNNGMKVRATKISVDANAVTITASSGKKISDATSQILDTQFNSFGMTAYGGNLYLN